MSDLRNNLDHAKHAYQRLQYDGDLADDVFARLDAERTASMRIDQPAKRAFNWRPFLAIAAAVAVVATTVVTLTRTGRDKIGTEVADTNLVTPIVETTIATAPPKVETPMAVEEVATDFSVVPSYQSFAISVPTSLSLASVDEYDRQAQEQSTKQTTSESTPATIQ